MPNVMVVAGGEWQLPLIRKAKELGNYVICSNLYADSPGFEVADIGEIADVLDKEKNLAIAKKHEVDIVITDQSDIAVPTVAYICQKLGIKGIGVDKAELFTNKYQMRVFGRNNGFATPEFEKCFTYSQAKKFADMHKKSILKPLNNQSSRGIYSIFGGENFEEKYTDTIKYSNGFGSVLIEEYIDGVEFTVDGIKIDNKYDIVAISEKKHYKHNENIASELLFTQYNEKYDYKRLRKENWDLVIKSGLPFGLTHTEYKYYNDKFYLIEMAARGGGTKISSDIVPAISGIDSNKILLKYLQDEKIEYSVNYDNDRCAILKFFDFGTGKVKRIFGLEDVCKWENVIDIKLDFSEGDTIFNPGDDRSRPGFYIAKADSQAELSDLCDRIQNKIRIEFMEDFK